VITASTLAKTAIVAGALALAVGFGPHGGASSPAPRAPLATGPRVDATSDAEARRLRGATQGLGAELTAAARCGRVRFADCVAPALRHAGIGGRTTAMLVRGVMAGVPVGGCRNYLFALQAANDAASEDARWLLPLLYEAGRGRPRREIAAQVSIAGRMLRRASRVAPASVCSPRAGEPAS
jgi:hypothetical protein